MSAIMDDDGTALTRKTTAFTCTYTAPLSNRSRCEHRFPNGSRCKARRTTEDGARYCMGHMSAHV